MPTNVRISDDIYDKLKDFADRERRSVANATEYLLALQLGDASTKVDELFNRLPDGGESHNIRPLVQKVEGSEVANIKMGASSRTKGDVLADIRDLESARDEELQYCQDQDVAKEIGNSYRAKIQPLWDEYNAMKGTES